MAKKPRKRGKSRELAAQSMDFQQPARAAALRCEASWGSGGAAGSRRPAAEQASALVGSRETTIGKRRGMTMTTAMNCNYTRCRMMWPQAGDLDSVPRCKCIYA